MAKKLSSIQEQKLLSILKKRFDTHLERHKGISWGAVETRLKDQSEKMWSLAEMEKTGGEPDVVGLDKKSGEYIFIDCSPESPKGRRSLCYDKAALRSRKDHPPKSSACDLAAKMKVEILTADEYRAFQKFGPFDTTTSSWIQTPDSIRKLGGALFCDRRYDTIFVYHNGAESYYAARGFRASLRV